MKSKFLRKIVSKYLDGTLNGQLRKLFDAYIDDKQVNANPHATDENMSNRILKGVNDKISYIEGKKSKRPYYWGAAAIILLCLGVIIVINSQSRSHQKADDFLVITNKGEKKKIFLPDGSSVTLNAQSKLAYPHDFGKKNRKVSLLGEAFFDVKHDSRKPFIVHSQKIDIRVLGTLFNVKAYAQEASETSLIRGSVQILLPKTGQVLFTLKPNEKFIFHAPALTPRSRTIISTGKNFAVTLLRSPISKELDEPTPWVQNRLSFDDQGFSEVAALLERWYNVKITIENPHVLRYRFTGTFNDTGLIDILNALQTIDKFSYRKEGDKIRIY